MEAFCLEGSQTAESCKALEGDLHSSGQGTHPLNPGDTRNDQAAYQTTPLPHMHTLDLSFSHLYQPSPPTGGRGSRTMLVAIR